MYAFVTAKIVMGIFSIHVRGEGVLGPGSLWLCLCCYPAVS